MQRNYGYSMDLSCRFATMHMSTSAAASAVGNAVQMSVSARGSLETGVAPIRFWMDSMKITSKM